MKTFYLRTPKGWVTTYAPNVRVAVKAAIQSGIKFRGFSTRRPKCAGKP